MRATTTPALFTRPRGVAAEHRRGRARAHPRARQRRRAAEADAVDVRLEVADQPPVEVATAPRAWPGRLWRRTASRWTATTWSTSSATVARSSGARKRLRQGDVVRLTDVVKERKTKRQKVRRGTVEVFTTKLKPGVRKVVRTGRPGVRKVVAMKTLHNGEPVKYRVVKRKVVKDPRPRRVLVGRQAYSVPGADGLNWGALANCESGGNPRAVNPAGYYGLYQFDIGTWRSVGGSGLPTRASAGEQTYRAKLLYQQRGRSPWPTCGRLL